MLKIYLNMAASINCAKRRKAKPARYGNGASVREIDRILTDPCLASVVPRRNSRRASIDSRNGESVDNTVVGNLVVEMRKQTDMVSNLITLVTALVTKLGGGIISQVQDMEMVTQSMATMAMPRWTREQQTIRGFILAFMDDHSRKIL